MSGLNAGLLRLGVWAPVASDRVADLHGPVMVLGFMGTLISLERAQAMRNPLAYLVPALLGGGSLALLAGAPTALGKLILLDGALGFVVLALALWRRAPLALVAAQALAALLLALAAGLWLVVDVATIIPLLAGFVVVTIASERAELAQLTLGPRAVPRLVGLAAWLLASGRTLARGCSVRASW